MPTLLLCLAQVTGDPRWFEERYRPRRDTNLFADESGGLPSEVQAEIRAAVVEMIEAVDSGALVVPTPDEATMVELMRLCVAEEVPAEYAAPRWRTSACATATCTGRTAARRPPTPSGCSSWGRACRGSSPGSSSGISASRSRSSSATPGPGRHVVRQPLPRVRRRRPNHFYSYSFAPNPGWSGYFSKQHEVLDYLEGVAERFGLGRRVSLGTEVVWMRWDDTDLHWVVSPLRPRRRHAGGAGRRRDHRHRADEPPEDPAGRHRPVPGRLVPLG